MGSSRPFGKIRKLPSGRYQARDWYLGKQVPPDMTFATKADARAWLAAMETDLLSGRHVDPSGLHANTATKVYSLFRAGATSGLRYGELTGLTRRVDQTLSFVKGEGPTPGPPKSVAVHRTVIIPDGVARNARGTSRGVRRRRSRRARHHLREGEPARQPLLRPYWKKALTAAGLDEAIRFHDLRHRAGTSAATAGASLREIMSRMGHASSDAILRYLRAFARRTRPCAGNNGRLAFGRFSAHHRSRTGHHAGPRR